MEGKWSACLIRRLNLTSLQAVIRNFWRNEFELPTAADFAHYIPAAADRVRAVNDGGHFPDGVNKLDFGRGFERSRWNEIVLSNMCTKILEARQEEDGWGLPNVSDDYLLGMLQGHLKRSRQAWAKAQCKFSPALGRVETEEEAQERLAQSEASRYASILSRTHRSQVSFLSRP